MRTMMHSAIAERTACSTRAKGLLSSQTGKQGCLPLFEVAHQAVGNVAMHSVAIGDNTAKKAYVIVVNIMTH